MDSSLEIDPAWIFDLIPLMVVIGITIGLCALAPEIAQVWRAWRTK